MSLQDDYFDLSGSLEGWQKEAFQRIWDAFVDMESEHEKLLEIRGAVRKMIELTFPSEEKQKEMVLVDDSASTVDEMKEKILEEKPDTTQQSVVESAETELSKNLVGYKSEDFVDTELHHMWSPGIARSRIIDAVEKLTMKQWRNLMTYERRVIECVGSDREITIYVNELHNLERKYGVFVDSATEMKSPTSTPRWQSKPSHLCGR